ncbi:hypothetical protein HK096_000452, partial [Nowakowskiella sp. JEL0078]
MSRVYKRYDTTIEKSLQTLETYGVATIPNIIPAEECKKLREEIWSHLKRISNDTFDVSQPKTWRNYIDTFRPIKNMLLHGFSLGHIQPVWDIRQNPTVASVFANLWNQSDASQMITSFDGFSAYLPIHDLQEQNDAEVMHIDQGVTKRGFQCIQGLITLYDVKQGDGTLNILEGSHKYHDEYLFGKDSNLHSKSESNFVTIHDMKFYEERGCLRTYVEAEVGSLILWDSRTVHTGSIPTLNDRFRM